MSNFSFLQSQPSYALFADACVEAEKTFHSSTAMCAIGCRKALELAVKWCYAADPQLCMPYQDNLQSLVHEDTFYDAVDRNVWRGLQVVIRLGNRAVHTERKISEAEAIDSMQALFAFIEWIDYCYGENYEERSFDEKLIPKEKVVVDERKVKAQQSLLNEQEEAIRKLEEQVRSLSQKYEEEKKRNQAGRAFDSEKLTEFLTRKKYIDMDLQDAGWSLDGTGSNVRQEMEVGDMCGIPGQKGFVDYVLMGRDGLPLAVIEAKKTSKDAAVGKQQAVYYADAIERMYHRRPMIYYTNGFDTNSWDDLSGPPRPVFQFAAQEDLQRRMNQRSKVKHLTDIPVSDNISGRYYQKEAIRAICENLEKGFRKNLLVMATGTGKTRTAAGLVDVLTRAGLVTNVLFLADRTELVSQAKNAFQDYLPDQSLCNLCSSKDDRNARIVFSTYPTMMNAIDESKGKDGERLFSSGHFDLIITDECHRSIFNKYKIIFDYFDAILVGLTATPKTDVDRNTYDFFDLEQDVPTYAYEYETAVYQDHVLVPYYTYSVKTKFTHQGIKYAELSKSDQERYEEDWNATGQDAPEFEPSEELNRFLFNANTVDTVLQDLMERGIKIDGGTKLGKTIIFAQNTKHAQFICDRFNTLYPEYHGKFISRIVCEDAYSHQTISDFKHKDGTPQIAVSVDMMDTGIDVPDCVNLVFFKQVMSKIKFWQMIGRGTRLCPDLACFDKIDGDYIGKKRFLIFDYCGNFEYFQQRQNEEQEGVQKSLSEKIFEKRLRLVVGLQEGVFSDDDHQQLRQDLVDTLHGQVMGLNEKLVSVKKQLQYVEKYRNREQFAAVSVSQKAELLAHIAPLVKLQDSDINANRFDNFLYGLMIADMEKLNTFQNAVFQLQQICRKLESISSVPMVKAELALIQKVQRDDFWHDDGKRLLREDLVRRRLRGLIRFLSGEKGRPPVYTDVYDPVIESKEGLTVGPAYDFTNYRSKVNQYVNQHMDTLAIYKLTHNKKLSEGDYKELERVLTQELGTKADYEREYGDLPFGLMIRKVAKLDHEAAMEEFAKYIDEAKLNQRQIEFVHKIIRSVEVNGYIDSAGDLMKPPFDKPIPFTKMFDGPTKQGIIRAIQEIKENATEVEA
jgi:type I restriction enzyme R subunit